MQKQSFWKTALRRTPVVRGYDEYSAKITEPVKIALVTDLHSTRYGGRQIRMLPSPRCFYVTGNHEQRIGNLPALKKMFASHGVAVLSGETRTVDVGGQLLDIGGVDDPTVFTRSRFVRQIPALWERQLAVCRSGISPERYSILLSHRPELARYYWCCGFDLVTAGHAHGGQVRIPGLINGLLAPHQGVFPRYAGGRYRLGATTMIISRGLCLNRLPRIFNPPELVVIRLLPALPASLH